MDRDHNGQNNDLALDLSLSNQILQLQVLLLDLQVKCTSPEHVDSTVCTTLSGPLQAALKDMKSLEQDAAVLQRLEAKRHAGQVLSAKEKLTHKRLAHKYHELETLHLQLTKDQLALQAMSDLHNQLERSAQLHELDSEGIELMEQAKQDLSAAFSKFKRRLLDILSNPWTIKLMLALFAGGLAVHFGIVNPLAAGTALMRQTKQIADSVKSSISLVQTISLELSKWAAGTIGGAVGTANGVLLASLLPGAAAGPVVVMAGAVGAYAGFTLFD